MNISIVIACIAAILILGTIIFKIVGKLTAILVVALAVGALLKIFAII